MALRKSPLVVVLVAAAVTLAGCGTTPPSSAPTSAPVSTSARASNADSLPAAADGDQVNACADGSCEVRVTAPATIPLNERLGLSRLRVDSISGGTVHLTATTTSSGGGAEVSDCSMSVSSGSDSEGGSLDARCQPGGSITMSGLTVAVKAVNGTAAILHLSQH